MVPRRDPEYEAPADPPERGGGVLLQFAGAGEIRKRVEDHRGRRHQPPVGEPEMDRDLPEQRQPDRQHQAEPGPRQARKPVREANPVGDGRAAPCSATP